MTSSKTGFYTVFAAILLATVAGGWAFTHYLTRAAERDVYREAREGTFTIAAILNHEMTAITGAGEAMNGSPFVAKALLSGNHRDIEDANRALDRYKQATGATVAYLVDRRGATIASSNHSSPDSFVGRSCRSQSYFQAALAGSKGVLFALDTTTHRRSFYSGAPVRRADGRVTGVGVMMKDLGDIETRLGQYGHWFLLSPDGIIFMSSRTDARLKSLWPLDNETQSRVQLSRQFGVRTFTPLLAGKVGDESIVTLDGDPYLVNRKDIGYGGWSLAVMTPAWKIQAYRTFAVLLSAFMGMLFLGVYTAFSILRESSDRVRKSEGLYRLLAEKSFAGIYVVQDGVYKYLNNNAIAYTGYAPVEIIGKRPGEIVHPEDIRIHAQDARDMIKGLRETPYEFRIITREGQVRWLMETVTTFSYENRPAILANCMDVTMQKQAAEALNKAYKELSSLQATIIQQQKMASIGQLAAGIAHEINTPLGFITGNLDVLNNYMACLAAMISVQTDIILSHPDVSVLGDVAAERKRLKIDHILRDGPALINESLTGLERISGVVQNLHVFSAGEDAEFREADVNEGLAGAIAVVRADLSPGMEMVASFGTLSKTRCNIGQLSQAFMAVLTNALQAIGRKGEVRVDTRQDNGFLVVSISDTGAGILDDLKDRIFEPFFTTREVGQGMGLGLSTAYDIVRKHKGEIKLVSELGKGSTFTIRIPVIR